MEIDNYELWEPIANLPSSPYFFELHHATGELTILLKEFDNPDKTLKVKFTGVIGYSVVNEAGRLRSLENSSLSTFCKSMDSEFLRWIKEESGGVFDDFELMHYVICNSDNIIDVISGPPVIAAWE